MSLTPQELAYQEAHIHENIAYQQNVAIGVFGVLAFACVVARLFTRRAGKVPLGLDDYLIVAAMVFGSGLVISAGLTTRYGVGQHIIAVPPPDLITFGKINFALELFYTPTLALGKLSVLALYVRIFRKANKAFIVAAAIVATWIVLWFIGVYLDVFLECRPLDTLWLGDCAPSFATSVSTSVLNIVSDVALLILPQPILWRLQMPIRKKLALGSVLCLGIFATAISIARIPILKGSNNDPNDVTFTVIPVYVFTVLEPMVIIICACLPVLQTLLRRVWDSGFGISTLLHSKLLHTRRSDQASDQQTGTNKDDWTRIQGRSRSSGDQSSETQGSLKFTATGSQDAADYHHFELGSIPNVKNQTGREYYETV